jgi:putative membrane protein
MGMVLTIFVFASIVSNLLDTQPFLVWSFFFGLVVASVVIVGLRVKEWTVQRVFLLLAGFVGTFIILQLNYGHYSLMLE